MKDELGLSLDKVGVEVLGNAARVELGKESCTIVGDGSTQLEVAARVKQINRLMEAAEADYEKEKLNERAARLSGGVAIIQVGAQTETELKEKKLRVEDALNATKAAVEEVVPTFASMSFTFVAALAVFARAMMESFFARASAIFASRSFMES